MLPADLKDTEGKTPVDLAKRKGNKEIADYIANYKDLVTGKKFCLKDVIINFIHSCNESIHFTNHANCSATMHFQ